MEKRLSNKCTGAGMFGNLFVGALLCLVTFGIYMPWFIVKMMKYVAENTELKNGARGPVRFDFKGKGAELFGIMIVGALLTMITLGIYGAWYAVSLMKFRAENLVGTDAEGREYKGVFSGTGGQFFGIAFVGVLLSMLTLGIYIPWFVCKVATWTAKNTSIVENGRTVGTFEFNGTGGSLFGKYLVGAILTMVTFGIYYAWFQVDLCKYFTGATTVTFEGTKHRMQFTGTGGKLFAILLVGAILSFLTLGIYGFWFITNLLKFGLENMTITSEGGSGQMSAVEAPAAV